MSHEQEILMKAIFGTILTTAFLLAGAPGIPAQGTWAHFTVDKPVYDLAMSGDDLWWASGTELFRSRMSDMTDHAPVLQDSSIAEVETAPDGRIWIIRNGYPAVRNGEAWTDVTRNGLTAPIRKGLKIDRRGVVWALTEDNRIAWLDGDSWNTFSVDAESWNTHQPGERVTSEMGDVAISPEGEPFILVDVERSLSGNTRWHNLFVLKWNGVEFSRTTPVVTQTTSGYGVTYYKSLHLHAVSDQLMWIGAIDGLIARYDGLAWTRLIMDHHGWMVNFFPESSGSLWVLDSSPIHLEENTQTDYSIPGNPLTGVASPDGTVWIGTSTGISRFRPENPLSVGDGMAFPASVSITGNFPNPFNPSTTITFTLPSAGRVELSVYSATGQKVRTLLSGPLAAGTHSAVWDGKDDSGKMVSSGIYIARACSGRQVAGHKMLFMK
jgi:ligand-binding sensor domain-containing protein